MGNVISMASLQYPPTKPDSQTAVLGQAAKHDFRIFNEKKSRQKAAYIAIKPICTITALQYATNCILLDLILGFVCFLMLHSLFSVYF